jgi:NADPH:quinone reductase-like Zn-dependent oxidoreductase
VDVIRLFRSQWSLIGSVRATADELRHVVGLVADGAMRPVIHQVFPLAEAAAAHRVLEERAQYGKLILAP